MWQKSYPESILEESMINGDLVRIASPLTENRDVKGMVRTDLRIRNYSRLNLPETLTSEGLRKRNCLQIWTVGSI